VELDFEVVPRLGALREPAPDGATRVWGPQIGQRSMKRLWRQKVGTRDT